LQFVIFCKESARVQQRHLASRFGGLRKLGLSSSVECLLNYYDYKSR